MKKSLCLVNLLLLTVITSLFTMIFLKSSAIGKEKYGDVLPSIDWKYEFPYHIKNIAISPGARWIVVATISENETVIPRSYIYLFKKNGNIEWKYACNEAVLRIDIVSGGPQTSIEGALNVVALSTRELMMFDKKGKIIWKTPKIGLDFDMSNDGNYIITSDFEVHYAYLYNNKGEQLWHKEDLSIGSPIGGTPKISYDGRYFLFLYGANFLDKTGNWVWTEPLSGPGYPSIEDVSKDFQMFSVSWVYPNKREIGVVDKRKNILWKYNIIKNVDVMTKLSPYGDYLVVDIDGEIHYFDKKGNLLWKKPYISDIDPNMGAEVATTEKGKYIVITQDFKSGAILDFIENNGEIIWHFNLPERSDHLCVSEKGKYIITTGHDGIGKWNKNIYFIKNTAISADE